MSDTMQGSADRRHGTPRRVVVALTALTFACHVPIAAPRIGFAYGVGALDAGTVAQATIDRIRQAGDPPILLLRPPPEEGARAALLGEVERAMWMAADSTVVAVVGPGGSREALQVAPVYQDAKVPNVVPTATSSRLHAAGPWTFMLAPDDSAQGEFLGEFAATRLGARVALLFYVPDEYGLGLALGTEAALRRRGIRLVDRIPIGGLGQCTTPAVRADYDDVVAAAFRAGTPDVIILAARTVEAACLARSVRTEVPSMRFLAGDGVLFDPLFLSLAGPATDSMYLAAFWHPSGPAPASRAFVAEFQRRIGRMPRHDDAMFFDATMVVAEAIRTVGADRGQVRDYLAELGRDRPPYAGITGPIAFAPGSRRPLLMLRIRHGATEPVPPQ